MSKPSSVKADEITAGHSIQLEDVTGSGVSIARYPWGYAVTVRHEDPAKQRLEFFVNNGNANGNQDRAILTLSAGHDNFVEFRFPGDAASVNWSMRKDMTCVMSPMADKVNGKDPWPPIPLEISPTGDLNLAPKGRLLINGQPLEDLLREMLRRLQHEKS